MENNGMDLGQLRESLLAAMMSHVPFDGWSDVALRAALHDEGIAPDMARVIWPRGALDGAVAYHSAGDTIMRERLLATDLTALRFRERIAQAVRFRLEAADRELVRRGAALFALPQHAVTGAQLVWGTADAIWTALGDQSDDVNWYTKRATLSAVYSATVLYWLGDDSAGHTNTWQFLDRRIENVMQFEKFKAKLRENPILSRLMAGPAGVFTRIRPPAAMTDLPGRIRNRP